MTKTKALAREYYGHGKELRASFERALAALDGPEANGYTEALARVANTDRAAAEAIDAFVMKQWEAVTEVNEALYFECERRALAPALARSGTANKGAVGKRALDPKAKAMAAIKAEWERRGRPGAAFAREMHVKYSAVLGSEKSIENAFSRWRKEK